MRTDRLFHRMGAELIGTFIMMFLGCGSIMAAEHPSQFLNPLFIAPIWGLSISVSIYALGHISGSHMNPAVTLAFAIARHFPLKDVAAYWIAQFIGAMLALLLLSVLIEGSPTFGLGEPSIQIEVALLWEFILSFILMFVIMSVATETRAAGIMAGAAIGATVMINVLVGGPFSGAAMNPVRALAPAIMQGSYSTLWIYFVGPFAGAAIAALLFEWLRKGMVK